MKTAFRWPVRVYYEDTDAGGVVYHANYLRFMERARSEWLSSLQLEHEQLAQQAGILFVVRAAQLDYLRPARLSDHLQVEVAITQVRRSSITFQQRILRGEELLTSGSVVVVAVGVESFRPSAIPQDVLAALGPWLPDAQVA